MKHSKNLDPNTKKFRSLLAKHGYIKEETSIKFIYGKQIALANLAGVERQTAQEWLTGNTIIKTITLSGILSELERRAEQEP